MFVLFQFGLRALEVAKPLAEDTIARTRPLLPLWARDAPWAWWAGGWSIALVLAASLRRRKATLKSAPQSAAKPSSPNARSSAAAPPETPSASASSPWVPLDFSPEGVKPATKRSGKDNTANTSNYKLDDVAAGVPAAEEKNNGDAQHPVEASTEDSVRLSFRFAQTVGLLLMNQFLYIFRRSVDGDLTFEFQRLLASHEYPHTLLRGVTHTQK